MSEEPEGVGGDSFVQALVHESPDALLALSPEGAVRFWSRGAEGMFGYTTLESLGRSLEDLLVLPEFRPELREILAIVLTQGSAVFETVLRRKEGTPVDVCVSLRRIVADNGSTRFIAAHLRDVTQLKSLREERATEAKFRGLLEAAPDAMVIVGPDGLITLVNSQTERLFGHAREALLGEPIEMLLRGAPYISPRWRPMGAGGGSVRPAQGRHRIRGRDQLEPDRDRRRAP